MKSIGHAALFIAALAMCTLALAQDAQPIKTAPAASEPAGTQPASAPTGPKIKLLAALKPGEAWALVAKTKDESTHQYGDQPPSTYKNNTTFDVVLAVDKGGDGEKKLQATFKRVREDGENNGEKKESRDTDNPASDDHDNKMAGLINTVMKIRMDDKNKVEVTEGLDKFIESLGGPDDAPERKKQADGVNQLMSQLLVGGFDFLPSGEVAVGETWQVKREGVSFVSGPDSKEKQELTCKLADVETTKLGRIAVIEVSGIGKIARQRPGQGNEREVNYTGYVKLNVDKQQLISVKLEMLSNHDKDTEKMIAETTFAPSHAKSATTAPASGPAATKPSQHE